ncbi:MAG: protein kinase [Deltaproteobacteria bacterium]|nr:protein kinase [Deltaproteobacteria bacterium]
MSPGPKADRSAPIPERVGRYEVLLPIASGGMATVYLARTAGAGGFERDVALKLTHAHLRENPEFAADLLEEAKLAVRIRHRNVVSVLDVGDDPLGLFLVMDYVHGDTLSHLRRQAELRSEAFPVGIGLKILIDALIGLHAAHELKDDKGRPLGLVHRDFSPQNILVGIDGIAQLTDFGIAKASTRLGHTLSGVVKGKTKYMSPEQARAQHTNRRADVWAAGIVAWEILAGCKLYPEGNEVGTLLKVATEAPPRLRTVNPSIAPAFEDAVADALTMDLAARCPTAAAFAQELRAACQAHCPLPDSIEVSEYVERMVGPKLAERERRAAEIISLRKKMGTLARSFEESISGINSDSNPIHMSRASQSSIPDVPPPPFALLAPAGPASSEPPVEAKTASPAAAGPEPERAVTDTTSVARAGTSVPVPRAPLVLKAVAGALVAIGVVTSGLVVWHWRSSSGPAATASSVPVTPGPSTELSTTPAASAAEVPSANPAPRDSSTVVETPGAVAVSANAPLRWLRVDDRLVQVGGGARDFDLLLESAERSKDCKLEAVSLDGRIATMKLAAGAREVVVQFPLVSGKGSSKTGRPPLATNPYSKSK